MKVLLAYDGFEHSENALAEAVELVKDAGTLTTVSVVPPDARGSKSGGHVGLQPHAHQDVAVAHKYLRERGIESEMLIEHGDPAEEIARVAAEGGYDLILAGSRERGTVVELLLGSVSKTLVRTAPCPVLVVGKEAGVRFEPTTQV
jgi:nucleotide-binding universal stress UspA family protein